MYNRIYQPLLYKGNNIYKSNILTPFRNNNALLSSVVSNQSSSSTLVINNNVSSQNRYMTTHKHKHGGCGTGCGHDHHHHHHNNSKDKHQHQQHQHQHQQDMQFQIPKIPLLKIFGVAVFHVLKKSFGAFCNRLFGKDQYKPVYEFTLAVLQQNKRNITNLLGKEITLKPKIHQIERVPRLVFQNRKDVVLMIVDLNVDADVDNSHYALTTAEIQHRIVPKHFPFNLFGDGTKEEEVLMAQKVSLILDKGFNNEAILYEKDPEPEFISNFDEQFAEIDDMVKDFFNPNTTNNNNNNSHQHQHNHSNSHYQHHTSSQKKQQTKDSNVIELDESDYKVKDKK